MLSWHHWLAGRRLAASMHLRGVVTGLWICCCLTSRRPLLPAGSKIKESVLIITCLAEHHHEHNQAQQQRDAEAKLR